MIHWILIVCWHSQHSMRSRVYVTARCPSVRLSIRLSCSPLAHLYLKKWWWPEASPGFGVTGHDDRVEVPKSPSGVGYGEECPLPSQLERAAGLLLWAWQVGNIDWLLHGRRRSMVCHSKCGQCHVYSWRRKLNTDLLIFWLMHFAFTIVYRLFSHMTILVNRSCHFTLSVMWLCWLARLDLR